MRLLPAAVLAVALTFTGCHSRYITATVTNRTDGPLSPVEVDYPLASFGTDSLAPGATYSYRFKVLGGGSTAVLWTDAAHHDFKASGPQLHEGDEGTLAITIGPTATPAWDLRLINRN